MAVITHSSHFITIHVCQIPEPYGLFSIDWEVPLGAISCGASGQGRSVKEGFLLLSHLMYIHCAIGNAPLALSQPLAQASTRLKK